MRIKFEDLITNKVRLEFGNLEQLEAIKRHEKEIEKKAKACKTCRGYGDHECGKCEGSGEIKCEDCNGTGENP